MSTGVLVSVMGVLTVACVYFWLVRKREPQQVSPVNAGPEQK